MIQCCYTDSSELLIELQCGVNVFLPAVVSTDKSSLHTVPLCHTISNAIQSNSSEKKTNAIIILSYEGA